MAGPPLARSLAAMTCGVAYAVTAVNLLGTSTFQAVAVGVAASMGALSVLARRNESGEHVAPEVECSCSPREAVPVEVDYGDGPEVVAWLCSACGARVGAPLASER